jgi:gliding motility-associated-like protein
VLKQIPKYLAVFCFVVFASQMNASHIVGGEIYYDYLGSDNYKITLKVYRDCFNGQAQLDNPARIVIFDVNGAIVDTLHFVLRSQNNIAPSINNPCITPPGQECVEEGLYVDTVNLPPLTGGYYIVYQRCCRNNTILNIPQPGQKGTTYWEHIPGPEQAAPNSSPRFNKFPPIYLCNGVQIKFDHSATDPDGDALVYSLCAPYDGCSPPGSGPCPITPPPYNNLQFLSPYSGSYPMSSNPVININSATGFLNGTPDINGQWVVCICVQEFRGGQLIGTHYRDFQFNIVTCQIAVLAQFNDQASPISPLKNQFCTGMTIKFTNSSINGTDFIWNFGDPSTFADTSHLTNPSYTYPDTGKYVVTLIANPGKPCADTTTETYYIYPALTPSFVAPPPQCIANNNFSFNVGGQFASYSTFNWTFGPAASIQTSTLQNPSGVVYGSPGSFPVSLLVQQKMCQKTLVDTVEVYAMPTASFTSDSISGCDPLSVTFTNTSVSDFPITYVWMFGDGTTSGVKNPTHVYSPAGVYNVSLAISSTIGCPGTNTFVVPGMVNVLPAPFAAFNFSPTSTTIFDPDIYFTNQSLNAFTWSYDFGDGQSSTVSDPIHTYNTYDSYTVVLTAISNFGCVDTAVRIVTILPEFKFWVPNCFTPGNKDGMNDVFVPIVICAEEYEFYVYTRWGELIFKSKTPLEGWDGTYKGKPCQPDVYAWLITFTNAETRLYEEHRGHVTILK